MPYSINTPDGLRIDNIPDDLPADAPELKKRVAQMRADRMQAAAPAAPADTPTSTGQQRPYAYSEDPGGAPAPGSMRIEISGTKDTPLPVGKDEGKNGTFTAPGSGYAMGLRDPIDGLAQLARRAVPEVVAKPIDALGNWLASKGFPVTPSNGVEGVDKIVAGVNKQYDQKREASAPDGQDPGIDFGRVAGNIINPVNAVPGAGLMKGANTVGSLALRGALSGAVGGAMQPVVDTSEGFAGQKVGQLVAGGLTGAALTPAISKGAESGINAVRGVVARNAAGKAAPDLNVAVTNVFQSQGVDPATVNDAIKKSVQTQIQDAIASRTKIDPAAIIRKAEFEVVGLHGDAGPTLGQMTRDPMQFAKEKNLSGINIDGGNQLADRFQAQNQRLAGVFDDAGARGATDRHTAGQTIIDSLRAADAPVEANVDQLYKGARAMSDGRVADLDRAHFSRTANEALDQGMWNAFLPPSVRNLLNDITAGKGPFNVESAVQIDSLLSKAQRTAERGGDDAGAASIKIIRSKLQDTPFAAPAAAADPAAARAAGNAAAADAARTVDEGVTDVPFRESSRPAIGAGQPGAAQTGVVPPVEPTYSPLGDGLVPAEKAAAAPVDDGQAARAAFDEARRAARSRFASIEDTPALKAALDEAAPDNFVRKFILGADVRDVKAMQTVLSNSPEAKAQARSQVADYLKRAAFGENPSGDKAFAADRYLRTLDALGKQKLELFFSPDEVVKLKLAGKVASDINSIPVGAKYGTNTSGTAAAAINAISGILGNLPGGSVLGVPINFAKNEYAKYQTQQAISQALKSATGAQPLPELSPELVRRLGLAGAFGAVAGGEAAGSNFGK